MTIILPSSPAPNVATPRPVDTGAWQQPIAGGTTTRLERPGNHLAVDYGTPKLTYARDARIWLSRILQALNQPARALFPQPGMVIGTPGAPVADGAGQAGLSLKLRGLSVGYQLLEGQALNVLDSTGRSYLHFVTGDAAAGGSGMVTLGVWPAVRAFPADGSACNIAAPVIEGRLTGNEKGLTMKIAMADGLQFSIEELR